MQCACVQSDRRWACTGTPINTSLTDLSGQFGALHMAPLNIKQFQTLHLKHGLSQTLGSVLFLLRTLMIRHSKAAVEASGAMKLPPKTDEDVPVAFTKPEWELYAEAYRNVKTSFDEFASVGASYCLTNTLQIMALLMPLRRVCSGGRFAPASLVSPAARLKRHAAAVAHHQARMQAAGAAAAAAPQSNEPADAARGRPRLLHLHVRVRGAALHALQPLVLHRLHPREPAPARALPDLPPGALAQPATPRGVPAGRARRGGGRGCGRGRGDEGGGRRGGPERRRAAAQRGGRHRLQDERTHCLWLLCMHPAAAFPALGKKKRSTSP